jgi:hypothetical protein
METCTYCGDVIPEDADYVALGSRTFHDSCYLAWRERTGDSDESDRAA